MQLISLIAVLATTANAYSPSSTLTSALPTTGNPIVALPDLPQLWEQVQQLSPLAKRVFSGQVNGKGLASIDAKQDEVFQWKRVHTKNGRLVEKLDNFQERGAPLLRFRASLPIPCVGEYFGHALMDSSTRKKWDAQLDQVKEVETVEDAHLLIRDQLPGETKHLGVGYCKTLASMGISAREQLFTYGMQAMRDGSQFLWGVSANHHDHLWPTAPAATLATQHLFCATLTPTSSESMDVEYLLQLDIGGNVPQFLTTPVMIDTIHNLFTVVASRQNLAEFLQSSVNTNLVMPGL